MQHTTLQLRIFANFNGKILLVELGSIMKKFVRKPFSSKCFFNIFFSLKKLVN